MYGRIPQATCERQCNFTYYVTLHYVTQLTGHISGWNCLTMTQKAQKESSKNHLLSDLNTLIDLLQPVIRDLVSKYFLTKETDFGFPRETIEFYKNQGFPDWSHYYEEQAAENLANLLFSLVTSSKLRLESDDLEQSIQNVPNLLREISSDIANLSEAETLQGFEPMKTEFLLRFAAMMNDLICGLQFGKRIAELLPKAREGDEGALMTILQVDKTILATDWVQNLIREAYLASNWQFFRKLGKALEKAPGNIRKQDLELEMLLPILWVAGAWKLTTRQILDDLLNKRGFYLGSDPVGTLRKKLNRLGLKRDQSVLSRT